MKIKIKKLTSAAIIPTYATEGSGCFDLYSTCDKSLQHFDDEVFNTGLSFEIPENHVMLIFSRSGHAFKNSIRLSNCVGVIDSDYRGEVKIKLRREEIPRVSNVLISKGDRIAQALVVPIPKIEFEEVDNLSGTPRGNDGFGSTGK